MRLPLAIPNDSRDTDRTQDTWAVNCFVEKDDALRLIKRPGLIGTYYTTPGTVGGGIFIWPSSTGPQTAVIWDDDLQFYVPSIAIGDLVSGYYAMVADPSTAPGPGDPYWSATPPTSDRWRGYWTRANYGMAATEPAALISEVAGSAAAAAKLWIESVLAPLSPGVAVLGTESAYSPDAVVETCDPTAVTSYTYAESLGTGKISTNINSKAGFITYPADWPGTLDWTSPSAVNPMWVGSVYKRRTTGTFTLTAVGTTATITSSQLNGKPYHVIEISGCDQPEYNGTFTIISTLDPTYPWNTDLNTHTFTLPSAPASSPATGASKQLAYYNAL